MQRGGGGGLDESPTLWWRSVGCMRLHGAWPPCIAVASGRAVIGFKLARLLFRRLNMKLYV